MSKLVEGWYSEQLVRPTATHVRQLRREIRSRQHSSDFVVLARDRKVLDVFSHHFDRGIIERG